MTSSSKLALPLRPIPHVTPETEFFWRSGASGVLQIMRCQACRHYLQPPRPRCPVCLSIDLAPEPVSGNGTIYSFTINHRRWLEGVADPPYVIARVELDEQPELLVFTNIVNVDPERVRIGQRVRVVFEQVDEVWLPLFEPEAEHESQGESGT